MKSTDAEQSQVILVDNNDCPIGIADKLTAHQQGLLHRAFSIFIFRETNNKFELLLQQRSDNKYHCAGLWTNTCCSHPQPGEDITESAYNRLKFEMGLECPLHEVGVLTYRAEVGNGLIEHEIDHIFIGKYLDNMIYFNHDEVQDYQWISLAKLEDDIQENLNKYTPWLKETLQIIVEKNILDDYFRDSCN
ncbi:MAG: isopentenyl-diphosphate Delta-isomerase [Gammaproteobacteria bacterium]|nr:isopentenyl-diphosphate Delta-isomerase [Gammaproteobacteria bacterium]